MSHLGEFFINGEWVAPAAGSRQLDVINPATEEAFAQVTLGTAADVDRAVAAARAAFPGFAAMPRDERAALIRRVRDALAARGDDLAAAVTEEMGATVSAAKPAHVAGGLSHLDKVVEVMETFEWERMVGTTRVVKEPIGVVGMITPWNWPLNQTLCKIAPALAAGCTMVMKPSELAPISALIIAEALAEAGVPKGVFNLVNGDGPGVGEAISAHPDVDMVSFTGSTRAGILVAKAAAGTVKRVAQELGGKSPNILLPDVDFEDAVKQALVRGFVNCGQSCNAATRILVPHERIDDVADLAAEAAKTYRVGPPTDPETVLGPLSNRPQFDKVTRMIEVGLGEARLVTGGAGRPEGLNRGYYVKPTIFIGEPGMTIEREEIFGPVLTVVGYSDEDDAARIANDTVYGLAGYVASGDPERAKAFARRLRAGTIHVNYPARDAGAPFGGYKQSGNGREWGEFGLEDMLETKGIVGWG